MDHSLTLLVIVFAVICCIIDNRYRLHFLRLRRDHEKLWRQAFREEEFEKVQKALYCICGALCIPAKYRFRLRPSDDIHKMYKRNNRFSIADSMEYEVLWKALKDEFAIDAEEVILKQPCTVGELIRRVSVPLGKPNVGRN